MHINCSYLVSQNYISPPPPVCPGEIGLRYGVDGGEESTYIWYIKGGFLVENEVRNKDSLITNNNKIIVDWIESSDITTEVYSLSVVEISSQGCIGDTTSVDIAFRDNSKIILENGQVEINLCVGEIKTFEVNQEFIYYQWEADDQTLQGEDAWSFSIAETRPVGYPVILRALSVDTCETVDTVFVNFRRLPEIEFTSTLINDDNTAGDAADVSITGDSIKICKAQYEISPGDFNNSEYIWSTGDDLETITMGEVDQDSTIYVTVTNQWGCSSNDSILITACEVPIVVPSAFTPDGDEFNETWIIEGIDRFPDAVILVFDRYQNKVFESKGLYTPWDGKGANGKLLPVDSYHYLIKLNDEKNQQFVNQVTIVY